MVANINKLKGKIIEKGYKPKEFADAIGMCELTVRRKINNKNSDFSIIESLNVKKILNLSTQDYLDIFFGSELEFNS